MNTNTLHENKSWHTTLEELLENQKDYAHLQIILSRAGYIKNGIGKKYLMVTPSSFGVVRLLDLDFNGEYIRLNLQDCTDGKQRYVPIDINDTTFKFLLIYWNDIEDVAIKEILSDDDNEEMLELEY